MPKFKQITLTPKDRVNAPEGDFVKVQLHIDSSGNFYGNIPDRILQSLNLRDVIHPNKSWVGVSTRSKVQLFNKRYEGLVEDLTKLFREVVDPAVTTELVIIYAVNANASYAQNGEGEVAKNARVQGFEWHPLDKVVDGRTGHVDGVEEAYKLAVGAAVYCKETTLYPNQKPQVKYLNVRHYTGELPQAAKDLNMWTRLSPQRCSTAQIIPYTDAKARAFDSLLKSIVLLSKKVTDFFTQSDALEQLENLHTPMGITNIDGEGNVKREGVTPREVY